MNENILKQKSYLFALKIVHVYKQLITEHKEYVLSRQLLKAGTSIGANIHEAEFAQSKSDFISKLSISLKEANETEYWLSLLHDSKYLSTDVAKELLNDDKEIISMLVSSIKTSKKNKV
jgi:four helix bundle protein